MGRQWLIPMMVVAPPSGRLVRASLRYHKFVPPGDGIGRVGDSPFPEAWRFVGFQLEEPMDTIVSRVCGLDVHEASVVACVLIDGGKKRGSKKVRTFTAMRSDIIALRKWLLEEGVTQVVMEGTG